MTSVTERPEAVTTNSMGRSPPSDSSLSTEQLHEPEVEPPVTDPDWTFRLLDLPIELQHLIIYHALGGPYDITLTYERISMLRSRFRVVGIPESLLPLLLTSRYLSSLTSTFHDSSSSTSLFTGRLILNSVFILVPLRRQSRFEYLRSNTRILHFSDSSVHPERWGRYFDSFNGLMRIEIEFPLVKRLDFAVGLDSVLEGKEDQRLIECFDKFMISSMDGGGLEFWVRARFALEEGLEEGQWQGVVICDITFNGKTTKIAKRRYALPEEEQERIQQSTQPLIRANGNILDEGSHQSLWEWHKAMTS